MCREFGLPMWTSTGMPPGSPFSWTASVRPSAVWTVRSIRAPSGVVDGRDRRQRAGPVPAEDSAVGAAEKPRQQVRLRAADLDGVRRVATDLADVTGVGGLQPRRQGGQAALVHAGHGDGQHLAHEPGRPVAGPEPQVEIHVVDQHLGEPGPYDLMRRLLLTGGPGDQILP